MSIRVQRLGFLSVLVGAAAFGFAGCDEESPLPPDDIINPPPVDPDNQQVIIPEDGRRPPPISGGTLLVSKTGTRAVVSDPDRDRIVVVDLTSNDVLAKIELDEGDEPGRVVEDSAGRAHVALRRGGDIVTIGLDAGDVLARRAVCGAPRGLASFVPTDGGDATLVVACATGEVVEIAAAPNGEVLSKTFLQPDLRDVVIKGDGTRAGRKLLVSSFRSASVLTLDADNALVSTTKQGEFTHMFTERAFEPTVAWRMVDNGTGATMIHQRSANSVVPIGEEEVPEGGGYGGQVFDCGSTIINAAVTSFDAEGQVVTGADRGGIGSMLLPVDVAVSDVVPAYGDRLVAMVGAGSDQLAIGTAGQLEGSDGCNDNALQGTLQVVHPEPIAVAFGPVDAETSELPVIVQLREPSTLVIFDATTNAWTAQIALGGEKRFDSGHQLFHRNPEAPTTISCASCHPEGGEDGHTWDFSEIGQRRTQSLAGNVMNSAPFHWDGDLSDLDHLMTTVFEDRMGGFPQSEGRVDALKTWLEKVPLIAKVAITDQAAYDRGKALFESDEVGCASCHSGARLTNNTTQNIGKGKGTQVPSLLGLAYRAPYMHDGCATTLEDRFLEPCGGTAHGDIAKLSEQDVSDIVTYMISL